MNVHYCPSCGHILYKTGKINTPITDVVIYTCKFCDYEIEVELIEKW